MGFLKKNVPTFVSSPTTPLDACSHQTTVDPPPFGAAEEVWACAVEVETTYGAQAEIVVAQRIKAAVDAGDIPAAALWRRVGATLRELYQIGRNLPPRGSQRRIGEGHGG